MRTLVDLPDNDLEELNELSRSRKTSRAQLIRLAVKGFLAQNRPGFDEAFGMWKDRSEDGVAYQERLRSEWER
ncbi:MAG TPA: ribbon-helix-helix protein, CopG family [Acidobacteriaceae bacterium]|nr:ribbon-helix-helix protein, CopG family [Acidobacteriaceae bacterium]